LRNFTSERNALVRLERVPICPRLLGLICYFMQTLTAEFPNSFSLIRRHFVCLQIDSFGRTGSL